MLTKRLKGNMKFKLPKPFYSRVKRNFTPLIFMLVICALVSLIYASASVYLFSMTIRSKGAVKTLGVGVYWDSTCNNTVSSLDWGIVELDVQKNVTFYVKNEGNVPGRLSLSAVNWDPPSASSYMTLIWDYLGKILEPSEIILVTLTLFISPDIQGIITFNFETVVSIS